MVEVEFNYLQTRTIIQANLNDSFQAIINKFITKTNLILNNLCFISKGQALNENKTVENIMDESERQNGKIIILVYDLNDNINHDNANIIKSNEVICPFCKESCKLLISNYKIKLYDCKIGHITENIKLNEFSNKQKIDISQIACDNCKTNNKSNVHNNEFHICYECKMNLCPLCKDIHEKTHSIINYDSKNYICNEHKDFFIKYCKNCKLDLCIACLNEHRGHDLISYEKMFLAPKNLRQKMNTFRNTINLLKYNVDEIIMKLKKIVENMNIYYNIYNDILINYENNKRNYNILSNISNINNHVDDVIRELKDNYSYGYNLGEMLYLYSEMEDGNSEMELTYQPPSINIEEKLRIFSQKFIKNNMKKCKIIYKDSEYDLKEYFEEIDHDYNNEESIVFKLKGINNITDMSEMFYSCYFLSSLSGKWNSLNINNMNGMFFYCVSLKKLPGLSELNTYNVTNMSKMFYGCNSLTSLPDISEWNTCNVTNMNEMFCGCNSLGCNSLTSLPDISEWNTCNVTNMNEMFCGCNSLTSLPDISEWNTCNVTNMSKMFCGCNSLTSLPDISEWKTSNIIKMDNMFGGCYSLISLPDLSKWNIQNVAALSNLFKGCISLKSIPDVSKWNLSKIKSLNGIFYRCESLSSLPDISIWNTCNVTDMSNMFNGCNSLISLPDISKWNIQNVTDISNLFEECNSLKSLPEISKWNTSKIENISFILFGCCSIISLPDISKWNTSKIKYMNSLFYKCKNLKLLPDISKWNTSSVIDMSYMFYECNSLSSLPDLSKWHTPKLNDISHMFDGCNKSLNIPSKFKV